MPDGRYRVLDSLYAHLVYWCALLSPFFLRPPHYVVTLHTLPDHRTLHCTLRARVLIDLQRYLPGG